MVSIANADAPWLVRAIGHRGELHSSASGKAFLAFLPRPAQNLLLSRLTLTKFTHNTITTLSALKSELARVRRTGFAVNNEEVEPGVRCIGAPIFDQQLARDSDAEHRRSRVSHDERSCSRAGSHRRERRQRTVTELGHPDAASWDAAAVSRLVGCLDSLARDLTVAMFIMSEHGSASVGARPACASTLCASLP